jgi:DNA anti-recombination protein RmuC
MPSDDKIGEILKIVKEERKLNNSRFTQLAASMGDLKQEMRQMNGRMDKLEKDIDKVHVSLSQDIQVFAEDVVKLKRRVDRIERRIA